MKYDFIDFEFLYSVYGKNGSPSDTESVLDRFYLTNSSRFGYTNFLSVATALTAGGYIRYTDGIFTATDKCAAFMKTGKKLFESAVRRRERLEKLFCTLDIPSENITPFPVTDEQYERAAGNADRKYSLSQLFSYTPTGSGLSFALSRYSPSGEDPDNSDNMDCDNDDEQSPIDNSFSLICTDYAKYDLPSALSRAVIGMVSRTSHIRKLCLTGDKCSYILTLSRAGDNIRISVSEIKYNRRTFAGRENGALDYAQCGDTVFDCIADFAQLASDTAYAYSSLRGSDGYDENITATLHRYIQ